MMFGVKIAQFEEICPNKQSKQILIFLKLFSVKNNKVGRFYVSLGFFKKLPKSRK